MGDVALGGTLQLLQRVDWGPFESLRLEPRDTWKRFYEERGFRSVAGFITGANRCTGATNTSTACPGRHRRPAAATAGGNGQA